MKLPQATEREIQNTILEYLAARRVFHYRQNTGAVKFGGSGVGSNGETRSRFIRFGVVGAPDIVAVVDGRYVGIEVKRPGSKQSPGQVQFARDLLKAGGDYILATSVEDVAKALNHGRH